MEPIDATMPEHAARELPTGVHPEVRAAYQYVKRVSDTADGVFGAAVWWHGWALLEAFLAGVSHARRSPTFHTSAEVRSDG